MFFKGVSFMKKVLSFILMLLVFPLVALADMPAPSIIDYEAEIINPDGAIIYDYKEITKYKYGYVDSGKKLDYGTKVKAIYEGQEDTVEVEIGDDWYTLKIKDIAPLNKEYKINKSKLIKHSGIILKNQEIRKGPSNGYESTGVSVKAGDNLTIYELPDDESMMVWVYVEYKGTNGYICMLKASVAYDYFNDNMMTGTELELEDVNGNKSTIPANTVIKGGYHVDGWSHAYYVEYDGEKGLIDRHEVGSKFADYKVIKEAKVYKEASNKSKIVGTVKPGTVIEDSYIIGDYPPTRLYYDGEVKGWLIQDYDEDTEYEKDIFDVIEKRYKVLQDLPVYKTKDADTKIGTIKKGEIIDLTYNCDKTLKHFICDYYMNNIGSGFIVFKGDNIDNIVGEYLKNTEEAATIVPTTTAASTITTKITEPTSTKKMDRKTLILLCIGGAVVVSITGVVILLLINKKKKKTNLNN